MIVTDIGPPDASIMLVGEAPGSQEDKVGKPFVGQSGQLLRQMLSHGGIDFNACYISNVVDERPPNNDFGYYYEGKNRKVPTARLREYWEKLREKVKTIKPNVVITLGGEAMRALTRKIKVSNWRGTIILIDDVKILPTLHPSYILRVYGEHPIVELDLVKALKESEYPEYRKPEVDVLISPSLNDVLSWIQSASFVKRISFDIETIGTHIRCLSLGAYFNKMLHAISIPFIKMSSSGMAAPSIGDRVIMLSTQSESASSYWNKQDEVVVLDALARILADEKIEKVGQNSIAFDAPLLEYEFGIEIKNHYLDTMHAWHILYPEFPKSLNFLVSVLTNHQNYWSGKSTEDDLSEWFYSTMDGAVTLECANKIEKELKDSKLFDFYRENTHRLAFALTKAQNIGVLIDKERQAVLISESERELRDLKVDLSDLTNQDFNPNSPKQVSDLLYRDMKFPVIYNKDGVSTVEEEALRRLSKKYPNEIILTSIIKYRKISKLISTYLKVSADEDGRMRTSYNASGTKGGRISSSKTIWKTGMNLQNIPVRESKGIKNIRDLFVAGEGNVFVKGDLRQAETMVVAHILRRLGDNTLYNKYQDPLFDIHKWGASGIFEIDESAVVEDQRDIGKLGNHSGNYMAGPRVLMSEGAKRGVDVSYELAKRVLSARARDIPGLTIWWRDVDRRIRSSRTLTTCMGRRRLFFGRFDDATLRDAVSWEPQSTVGDVCNRIFKRLSEGLKKGCEPLLQVHDECVVECPERDAEYVVEEMRKAANIVLFVSDEPLLIPIDVSTGVNWKDCKEI